MAVTLRGGLRESAQRHLLTNVNYGPKFLHVLFDMSQTSRLHFGDLDHVGQLAGR
jgi:hypothetical protein